MSTDKRKRSRVASGEITGKLLCSGTEIPITLINISLNGALVKQCQTLPEHNRCTLILPLAETVVIQAEAHIVRRTNECTALTFDGIDPDSYSHLHRLVQLHAAEPDAIDDELASPCR